MVIYNRGRCYFWSCHHEHVPTARSSLDDTMVDTRGTTAGPRPHCERYSGIGEQQGSPCRLYAGRAGPSIVASYLHAKLPLVCHRLQLILSHSREDSRIFSHHDPSAYLPSILGLSSCLRGHRHQFRQIQRAYLAYHRRHGGGDDWIYHRQLHNERRGQVYGLLFICLWLLCRQRSHLGLGYRHSRPNKREKSGRFVYCQHVRQRFVHLHSGK